MSLREEIENKYKDAIRNKKVGEINTLRLIKSAIKDKDIASRSSDNQDLIKNSEILILSSQFEGLPNVLLEAQYLKKYIISTDCPTGPKEILLNGRAGDLIKIGDYKRLSFLISNYYKRKKIINKKINVGFKNFYRFDYNLNCKKYLEFVKINQ